jgi:excisionase family DNA binding protein
MRQTQKLAKALKSEQAKRLRDAEKRKLAKSRERAARLQTFNRELRYTIDEAAVYLGCSRAHVYRVIQRGELTTIQDGRRTYVPGSAIAARCQAGV